VKRQIAAKITGDAKDFVKAMQEAETSIEKFTVTASSLAEAFGTVGMAIDEVERKTKRLGQKMAATGTGMAISLGFATKQASDFQREMLNVNSIAGESAHQFERTQQAVIALSRQVPQSAEVLAAGLYDISSSGFQGAEALEILEAAAISASAGLTQAEVSSGAIAAILNAYGLQASEATDISDILFQTVNVGVLTFEELAVTVGDWVATAAAAGIAADEAAAAIATMTLQGINASEASTALARVMQSFIDPSEAFAEVIEDLGYSSGLSMVQTEGLAGAMAILQRETGGSVEQVTDLFNDIRAGRGALALMAQEGQLFAEVAGQVADESQRAGAAADVFAVQAEGLGFQMGILSNNMNAFAIEIGQTLIPVITKMVELATLLAEGFNALPGPVKQTIAVMTAIAAVGLIVSGVFIALFAKQIIWQTGMNLLSQSFSRAAASATGLGAAGNVAAAGLAKAGTAASVAATKMGPLSTITSTARLGMMGLGKAAGTGAARLAGFATTGVLAAFVLWDIRKNSLAARDAMNGLADSMRESFNVSQLDQADAALERMRQQVTDLKNETFGFLDAVGLIVTGQSLPGFGIFGGDDGIIGRNPVAEKAQAEAEAMQVLIEYEQRSNLAYATIRAGVAEARGEVDMFGESYGASLITLSDGTTKVLEGQDAILRSTEDLSDAQIAAISSAAGVDLSAIYGGTATAEDIRRIADEVVAYEQALTAADPASGRLALQLIELSDEATTVAQKFDLLNQIFRDIIDDSFAFDEATDNVNSLINGIAQSIIDLEGGTSLAEAMDFDNFSDEAIGLRDEFRGLIGGVIQQTQAWAESQENLTGIELAAYIQDQIGELEGLFDTLELTEEQADAFLEPLKAIAENPDIFLAFDNNLDEDENDLDSVEEQLERIDDLEVEPSIGLDISEFERKMRLFESAFSRIPQFTGPTLPPDPTQLPGYGSVYNADGGHYPTIARGGPMRIWNEPETGGEAYIPLGKNKRATAMPVLMQVLKEFGIMSFANGGINIDRPDIFDRQPGATSGVGGGGGGIPSPQAILGLSANQLTVGAITQEEYEDRLRALLGIFDEFSNDYTRVWSELDQFDKERVREAEDRAEEEKRAAEEAIFEKDRLMSTRFVTGDLERDQYLEFLQNRLDGTEEFTDEWFSYWREIQNLQDQITSDEAASVRETQRIEDLKYEIGTTSTSDYLVILRDRLAGLEEFSEEWAATWRLIQQAEQVALEESSPAEVTSNRLSDFSGAGFVSTNQLTAYYERKARDAVEWYGIVQRLSSAGVSPVLIQDLLAGGPSSLPMAKAIERMYQQGDLAQLTSNLDAISAVERVSGSFVGNVSGTLPTLGNAIGGGEGAIIIEGDMYFSGIDDVREFIENIEFEIASRS